MIKVLSIFGTRPEAIKFAPVIHELAKNKDRIKSAICVTAQHREMLDQILELFKIQPDYDLDLMSCGQGLAEFTGRALKGLDSIITRVSPDWVLVQGDTTTTMVASLAAFYHKKKIGHIEAGLRSNDKYSPFPEEINRRIASLVAEIHFAPTDDARQSLLAEGVPDSSVFVTGNTVVDSLLFIRKFVHEKTPQGIVQLEEKIANRKILLVTGHRRECFGEKLLNICSALEELANYGKGTCIVFPVHPNPEVSDMVRRRLGGHENIFLIEPLRYSEFVWLMNRAYLIITDSGGIQEEAPILGKPVLITRKNTERFESVISGNASLVGTDQKAIVDSAKKLLCDRSAYHKMAISRNTYGDGKAAERIVRILTERESTSAHKNRTDLPN